MSSSPPGIRAQPNPSHAPGAFLVALVASLGILLAGMQLAVILPGSQQPVTAVLIVYTAVFVVYIGAGVLAWMRRPSNGMGPLLIAASLAVYAGNLGNASVVVLALVGDVFATVVFAAIVQLLLAFPSGRLRGTVSRVVVSAAYAVAVLPGVGALIAPGDPQAQDVFVLTQRLGGLAVMVVTAGLLARTVLAADAVFRRLLLPLYGYGIFAVLAVPASAALFDVLGAQGSVALATIQLIILAGVPVAFVAVILRGGFPRSGGWEELSEALAVVREGKTPLRDALARTLGDETLRLVFTGEDGAWIDERGEIIDPPPVGGQRALIPVMVEGRTVASIEYDPRLTVDGDYVRRVGQVIAVAIDRARLSVELLRSRRELMASRARLVDAADRERLRIAQDLHDGLQMQLVLLALEAQQIANAAEEGEATSARSRALRVNIDAAASDLRRLVHDVLPLPLVGRGLGNAIEDLVDRIPIPTALEMTSLEEIPTAAATTAYFVVSEALTNAVKHAHADRVTVTVARVDDVLRVSVTDTGVGGAHVEGRGLGGLVDRVEAVGGSLTVTSVVGAGTNLRMEIPCG